jgi:16S rRNA (uracil1498-N3)-methyltransferase
MKHRFRFLARNTAAHEWQITDEEELHHLKKVLRLKEGDAAEVFDGAGASGSGVITAIEGKQAVIECTTRERAQAPSLTLHLAIGALKPGSIDELLPSLVELGVDSLHIFLQQGVDKSRLSGKALERWQRIILASCKQSKRDFIPQCHNWPSLQSCLEGTASLSSLKLCLDPDSSQPISQIDFANKQSVFAVMGGEAGLSAAEEELLTSAQFHRVSLGPNVLRAYTAAIAVTALLSDKRAQSV